MNGAVHKRGRALLSRGGVYLAAILVLVVFAAAMGMAIYREIQALRKPQDDIGWAVFQLGLEHQRLQLAVETGAPLKDVLLRGDIYLSRVALVRDAPALASLRDQPLQPGLHKLFALAQKTEILLDALRDDALAAKLLPQLREELREDAPVIRAVTVDMSNFNRDQLAESRATRTQQLIYYLTVLEVLLLGMLALAAFAWRVNLRLQWAGRAIEQQKATLEAILNSVDDAIIGIGAEREILYSNPRGAELLHLGRDGRQRLAADSAGDPLVNGIHALLAAPPGDLTGRGLAGLCAISLSDGDKTRHYEIRKFLPQPLAGAGQGSSAIIAIADVTLEAESARKRDEYDSRIADLSRLHAYAAISGGIVHEISQPLAAIKNYLHALKAAIEGRQSKAERMHLAEMAGEEVDRAIQVVRNVRKLGPQGPGLAETGTCDLREAVAHSVRLVVMGRKPAPPIAVAAPDRPVIVTGSLPLIGQVLVNLLRNGLEASEAAGRAGAAITVTVNGGDAEVTVADHGAGVSPAAAQTLFTPFSMSSHGGMGLGLAICKRIADMVGGSLSWHNAENGGAIFTFAIPLAKEQDTR